MLFRFIICGLLVAWTCLLPVHAEEAAAVDPNLPETVTPDDTGALKMLSASYLNNSDAEGIRAVAVSGDLSILLGGGGSLSLGEKQVTPINHGNGGFILKLSTDGRQILSLIQLPFAVSCLQVDDAGAIYAYGDGTAIKLSADGKKKLLEVSGGKSNKPAFAVNTKTGELALIRGKQVTRYDATGKEKWSSKIPAYGGNRPRAVAIDPVTDTTMVVGYGMTHTGKEPWKDPYAHGYDAEGKLIWTLWNPNPKDQKAGQFGGTGLMADGTGNGASITGGDKFLVLVFHDGGNAVSTRDPQDPRKDLNPAVLDGVYQKGPGWGMRGAITTSVCYRVDPKSGTLEKGSWMCAWLNDRKRANSLGLEDVAGDRSGRAYVTGNSAAHCPKKTPWFQPREDEYPGGGMVAVFSPDFKLLQCGTFPWVKMQSIAARDGVVVAAGKAYLKKGKSNKPIDVANRHKVFNPLQEKLASDTGGYFLILHDASAAIRPRKPAGNGDGGAKKPSLS